MKKNIFFILTAILFIGCSSDGSRELQIDEVKYYPFFFNDDGSRPKEIEKESLIVEVVPGKYDLSWKLVDDVPQLQRYDISLQLRIRLKKQLKIATEAIDKVKLPFDLSVRLIDADGNFISIASIQIMSIKNLGIQEERDATLNNKPDYNIDQCMDFLRFLQSEPGAEMDITVMSGGAKFATGPDCIKSCKEAKGIVVMFKE